jgi:GAF domain-containing protein
VKDLAAGMSGAWYILNEEATSLSAVEAFGPAASVLRSHTMRVGDRLTGWVAATRQVIINSDAALDLGERLSPEAPVLHSCLSVPLTAGGDLVGVLTLYASEAFSEDHGRLLQMVAPHIATGIDAAKRRQDQPQIQTSRDLRLVSSRRP